jgi:hypothetical protein
MADHPGISMESGEAGAARVRETLAGLVALSGLSQREIARRLARQGCGLDVSRLLGGKFELRLRQVLDVIHVLGIHPVEFFRLVFNEPEKRSPLLERVQILFAPGKRLAGPPPLCPVTRDLGELCRRLDEMEQWIAELRAPRKAAGPGAQPATPAGAPRPAAPASEPC